MQIQLIEIKKDKRLPQVSILSGHLGYVMMDKAQELDLPTIRSDAEWWEKVLRVRELGAIVDSAVGIGEGIIESNDRAQILDSIECGGEVFYVTFVHRVDGYPVFFSLYKGGQLAVSQEDCHYLTAIGACLPT